MNPEFSQNWQAVDNNNLCTVYDLMAEVHSGGDATFKNVLQALDNVIEPFGLNTQELSIQTVVALLREVGIFLEYSGIRPEVTRHYLQDRDTYLSEAQSLRGDLKTPGNFAVLMGCGNLVSAIGFVNTIHEISSHIRPVIVDVNVDHFIELDAQTPEATVLRMTALQTGFPSGSAALVHSHYISKYIYQLMGGEGTKQLVKEASRITHHSGVLTLIEEPRYYD